MKKQTINRISIWKSLISLNFYLFPIFFTFGSLIALAEVYKYKGFFEKHFSIQIDLFYALAVISGMIIMFSLDKLLKTDFKFKLGLFYKLVLKYSPYFFLAFIFLSLYFHSVEAKKGLNYIFSTYHVQPNNASYLLGFSWLILLISLLSKVKLKTSD